jgi:hypothetical protein
MLKKGPVTLCGRVIRPDTSDWFSPLTSLRKKWPLRLPLWRSLTRAEELSFSGHIRPSVDLVEKRGMCGISSYET